MGRWEAAEYSRAIKQIQEGLKDKLHYSDLFFNKKEKKSENRK